MLENQPVTLLAFLKQCAGVLKFPIIPAYKPIQEPRGNPDKEPSLINGNQGNRCPIKIHQVEHFIRQEYPESTEQDIHDDDSERQALGYIDPIRRERILH